MKNMRTKLAATALAVTVAFGAVIGFSQPADAQRDRSQHRQERLQTLVDDGVISQEQADEIESRMADFRAKRDERRAERSKNFEDLASTLGMTADELKADLRGGASIADLAEAAGVDVETIIDQIESQITARIDEAVADGKIDQERADEQLADLRERITARVKRPTS